MSAFDTSGEVRTADGSPIGGTTTCRVAWADLSTFHQGYIEALFASGFQDADVRWPKLSAQWLRKGFSDLAPETLAAILKDCEDMAEMLIADPPSAEEGRTFWNFRQQGYYEGFPPLTPHLGDDGKVYLWKATR